MSEIDDRIAIRTFDQKGDGAISFRYKDFWVLLSVKRIKDLHERNLLIKKHKLEKPASSHTIKCLGFRIVVTDENVEVLTYSKHPITVGNEQWLYNIQGSSVKASFVCTIGFRVSYADKPAKVDFLTKQKIDAALAAYRYGIEQCEFQLREELMRIYSGASHNLKEELIAEAKQQLELEAERNPTPTPAKPVSTAKQTASKTKTKQIVRFKSRS